MKEMKEYEIRVEPGVGGHIAQVKVEQASLRPGVEWPANCGMIFHSNFDQQESVAIERCVNNLLSRVDDLLSIKIVKEFSEERIAS